MTFLNKASNFWSIAFFHSLCAKACLTLVGSESIMGCARKAIFCFTISLFDLVFIRCTLTMDETVNAIAESWTKSNSTKLLVPWNEDSAGINWPYVADCGEADKELTHGLSVNQQLNLKNHW